MPITLTLKGNTFHGLIQNVRENYFVPGYKASDTQCAGIVLAKLFQHDGDYVAVVGLRAISMRDREEGEKTSKILKESGVDINSVDTDTASVATLLSVEFPKNADVLVAMMYGLEDCNWHSVNGALCEAYDIKI